MENDEKFMREALREAALAGSDNEIPIGAVIVCRERVIARGHNMVETLHDPTAHAEMIALTAATEALGGKYLSDCTIYVTVEPYVRRRTELGADGTHRMGSRRSQTRIHHVLSVPDSPEDRNSVRHPRRGVLGNGKRFF